MDKDIKGKKTENKNTDFLPDHHAYVISGVSENVEEFLSWLEKNFNFKIKGNPDFLYYKFETLTVDDARKIKGLQENKSFLDGSEKIFVLNSDVVTVEAQNSFLKMFEEPTSSTRFFIVGNCVYSLLPTLISRVISLQFSTSSNSNSSRAKNFLKSSKGERLSIVKKIADEIKDEKIAKSEAVTLVNEIELYLYEEYKNGKIDSVDSLRHVEVFRNYLQDRSSSVKMILEIISIILPQI